MRPAPIRPGPAASGDEEPSSPLALAEAHLSAVQGMVSDLVEAQARLQAMRASLEVARQQSKDMRRDLDRQGVVHLQRAAADGAFDAVESSLGAIEQKIGEGLAALGSDLTALRKFTRRSCIAQERVG